MDYEQLITDVGIQPLQLYLGLAMGLAFGIGATLSQFCLRRLVLDLSVLKFGGASYTWLFGLGIAIMFTQLLLQGDTGDISEALINHFRGVWIKFLISDGWVDNKGADEDNEVRFQDRT